MKTAELSGAQLDYWVAKAMYRFPGHEFRVGITTATAIMLRDLETGVDVPWAPSTDWAQGGPIIEREKIVVGRESYPNEPWRAAMGDGADFAVFYGYEQAMQGPTFLIAAMRAYVASKVGDEVPDACS